MFISEMKLFPDKGGSEAEVVERGERMERMNKQYSITFIMTFCSLRAGFHVVCVYKCKSFCIIQCYFKNSSYVFIRNKLKLQDIDVPTVV